MRRAAVVVHGKPETLGDAVARLEGLTAELGVELTDEAPELAIVLGGDGTMLRAFKRFLGTGVPVLGVNFGRVGFLTTADTAEMESALRRALAGDYVVYELPTLETEVGGETVVAVNDVVAASSALGRMVELDWFIGGESMGRVPCDGVICCTPSGSTAYNLSNGGPVLMWGIDAAAITFVAPHSLDARPVVVPRGRPIDIRNETPGVALALIVDGHVHGQVPPGGGVQVRLGEQRSLLAMLPEVTFVTRYRKSFA